MPCASSIRANCRPRIFVSPRRNDCARSFSRCRRKRIASGCFSPVAPRKTIASLLAKLCARSLAARRKSSSGSDRDSGLAAALGRGGWDRGERRDRRVSDRAPRAIGSKRRADGATSWAMPAADIFFRSRRFGSFCANTICTAAKRNSPPVSCARFRLNSRDELVRWAQTADKMEVARSRARRFRSGHERRRNT